MELWDLLDRNRMKTGKTITRGEEMRKEDYHLVVHVWIMNDEGEFLIQQRQPWKIGWPNSWDCAAAGSAVVGDTSKQAVIREVKEELGIDLDRRELEHLFTIQFKNGFDDIWFVKQNMGIESLKLQVEEVQDAKWVSFETIQQMIVDGTFIPYSYLEVLIEFIDSPFTLKQLNDQEMNVIEVNFLGVSLGIIHIEQEESRYKLDIEIQNKELEIDGKAYKQLIRRFELLHPQASIMELIIPNYFNLTNSVIDRGYQLKMDEKVKTNKLSFIKTQRIERISSL
jgi:isopentenyldiphosphate isomerase